ncbi:uncharacterized protein LOC124672384 [Lolium rigidum]|uniref:uncharacterized protein LOC124672384 n=1 Tax=Lolium rigidum TaxID=89674 RepID=UPI001F5D04D2|nr:uncharacterized protein LOC124672384 [Lolium rigidum]
MASYARPWEYRLRKYLLLLAMVVVTVTYAVAFNLPGGVWRETAHDHLPGDPIFRSTNYRRYLVFFYCNALAFAASLVVIVLILVLDIRHDKEKETVWLVSDVVPLRVLLLVDFVGLMGSYVAGSCQDKVSTMYFSVLVAAVLAYIVLQTVLSWWSLGKISGSSGAMSTRKKLKVEERFRKVLMLFSTFVLSFSYVAGLSTPGGYWKSNEARHLPGDAILRDRQGVRLTIFLLCNTTVFLASLLIIILLIINKKLLEETEMSLKLYGCILAVLVGLFGAYTAGSCRKVDTTVYLVSLVGAIVMYIELHLSVLGPAMTAMKGNYLWTSIQCLYNSAAKWLEDRRKSDDGSQALNKSRSLVLLLATLMATTTYKVGLDPPGGFWESNGRYNIIAGDPLLLKMNPRRYKAFYYCNSVSFVASLVAIVMVQKGLLVWHHMLEVAMALGLFGLMGAYLAGSLGHDVKTSIYIMALFGAVLVYFLIHIVFFTLDRDGEPNDDLNKLLEKRRKWLLLFEILAAAYTYQAGVSPSSNFLLGSDKVLPYYFQIHYEVFFYCNSASFMVSMALIILLTNTKLYRAVIQSNVLSVFTAAGLICLMGAFFATGYTRNINTSIYIFALVAVVLFFVVLLSVVFLLNKRKKSSGIIDTPAETCTEERTAMEEEEEEGKRHARRKYLMMLGILVASVTYQAGLKPPGGTWLSSYGGYEAGNPVMHDSRRTRYLVFFYGNSTSFVASIVVIVQLLRKPLQESNGWLTVIDTTILLDLAALLGAYIAGSSRGWETSACFVAVIIVVLGCLAIPTVLSFCCSRNHATPQEGQHGSQESPPQSQGQRVEML